MAFFLVPAMTKADHLPMVGANPAYGNSPLIKTEWALIFLEKSFVATASLKY